VRGVGFAPTLLHYYAAIDQLLLDCDLRFTNSYLKGELIYASAIPPPMHTLTKLTKLPSVLSKMLSSHFGCPPI